MTEQLLHHLWKYRLFNQNNITTINGQPVQVISPGLHNTDSGPDFFNARLKIGDTEWAGNVEIHINESDWNRHNHQHDEAYKNVILHVVYKSDSKAKQPRHLPVLELKNYIDDKILKHYDQLMLYPGKIPCEKAFGSIDHFTINNWLDRMLIERLENKTESIAALLSQNQNNWEETFYIMLARNFGFKVNAVPFELLARSLPLNYLAKHKSSLFQLEALLYGQAGLLNSQFKDEYPNKLKREYDFLRKKFSLITTEPGLWKFMRMRPVNFPSIRLAQFAQLIHRSSHLFSKLIEAKSHKDVLRLFDVGVSEYWTSHFVFDKKSTLSEKHLGTTAIENIIINTVSPLLFHFGKTKGEHRYQNRAIELLEKTPAEENQIIKRWHDSGYSASNAAQTQALIQLYNFYCTHKKCLLCAVGNKILRAS